MNEADGYRDSGYRQALKETPGDLLNIIDKDMLRELLNDFTTATGLSANIITTQGKSIFTKKDAQAMCEFCKLVRSFERRRGLRRCAGAYERAGKQAARYREASIFRCPSGLVEWIYPIILEDTHIGSIVCGQVLMWEPEEFFWVELEQLNREITDDVTPLIEAAKELQVISADKVQASSKLIGLLANSIVKLVWEEMRRKDETAYQKQLLDKEKGMRMELERQLNVYSASYYRDQITGLVNACSAGEFGKARSIYTVILADIINRDRDMDYVRTQLFDLVFKLFHAAIDCGADSEACTRAAMEYCTAERRADSLDALGQAAGQAGHALISGLEEVQSARNPAVDAMCGYIKAHLSAEFSINDVADSVQLSPYYASRLFKKSEGVTIMEYATNARISEAKYLLSNPKYRIEEVALMLGYSDASYFGRVFRKKVGMSPRQYRVSH